MKHRIEKLCVPLDSVDRTRGARSAVHFIVLSVPSATLIRELRTRSKYIGKACPDKERIIVLGGLDQWR
jgi:hypothetical protein